MGRRPKISEFFGNYAANSVTDEIIYTPYNSHFNVEENNLMVANQATIKSRSQYGSRIEFTRDELRATETIVSAPSWCDGLSACALPQHRKRKACQ